MLRTTLRLATLAMCLGTDCTPRDPIACDYAPEVECADPGGLPYSTARPPNVMLLVDRSGSMADAGACSDGACPSKWDQLMALEPYVEGIDQAGNLGLTLFPSPAASDGCSVEDGIVVPIGDATGVEVSTALQRTRPSGSTPLAAALEELEHGACLADPLRDNVVILLTDGEPNCACKANSVACQREAAVDAARSLVGNEVPVELYVIGFGASASAAGETLKAVAGAASATSGTDNFYRADTVEELAERMYRVAGQLGGCTYVLDSAADLETLRVFVNDQMVERCLQEGCVEGWTSDDGKAVRLLGVTCRDAAQDCPPVRFE